MASVKVTFTLDAATVALLQEASERLTRPKSEVVREAILDYYERIGRLSERERLQMLRTFDELVPKLPRRSAAAASREIAAIRASRRAGGRRSPVRESS